MAGARAPKQWSLSKNETITSFESWRQNLLYTLSLDNAFTKFLDKGAEWQKKTADCPTRGFSDDSSDVPVSSRLTAAQKTAQLELMLGQIANFCPIIARNSIVKNSTSHQQIWQSIRLHFGFQSSGSHLLDFAAIQLQTDERPEDLFQRLMAFAEDNLLKSDHDVTHHGKLPSSDEDMSPSLENFIVLHWLSLLHPRLPALVKQRYGPELRSRTLASLKPEISQSVDSLLAELHSGEHAQVLRSTAAINQQVTPRGQLPGYASADCLAAVPRGGRSAPAAGRPAAAPSPGRPGPAGAVPNREHRGRAQRSVRPCALCASAGRPGADSHFLSRCRFLPLPDRRFMAGVRLIAGCDDFCDDRDFDDAPAPGSADSDIQVCVTSYDDVSVFSAPSEDKCFLPPLSSVTESDPSSVSVNECVRANDNVASGSLACRIQPEPSPFLPVHCGSVPLRLTLDSRAEINLIRDTAAALVGACITKTSQNASQADGHSRLTVVGEITLCLHRGPREMILQALVVQDLDVDVLAGTPFMSLNDISVRPADGSVSVGSDVVFHYLSSSLVSNQSSARPAHRLIRAPSESVTLWPGDYVELGVADVDRDVAVCVEPWVSSPAQDPAVGPWPKPTVTAVVDGKIRVPNNTDSPLRLQKNSHFCKIYSVTSPPVVSQGSPSSPPSPKSSPGTAAGLVSIDPHGLLSDSVRSEFAATVTEYGSVFDPDFSGYNGAVGHIQGTVNIGAVQPPQRRGHLPQYDRKRLSELQSKFDELEALGVIRKPEDLDVAVEYVHPSFLVNKPSGGCRLVTDFTTVGRFCKPQPSLLPDVESTLRTIGGWKYIIVTDLTKAYFQVPLSRASMKYCGVVTPFKGVRVYTRCAMGLPGSESALEELMSRVLGDLIQDGRVTKIADDLFCGGATPEEALENWRLVLQALDQCDLRLSASKTVICPRSVTILGWVWSDGQLSASPHRISTLASAELPRTVKNLRSFIGAYKVLSRVVKGAAYHVSPLDAACAGRESSEVIVWTDELSAAFHRAQSALRGNRAVVLPRPSDDLWIVTDGSSKLRGIGATLYVTRHGRTMLAGFFSAQLRKHQNDWLPCEIEALAIAAAVKHYAPYIIQASSNVCLLTDSKPCVQAIGKLGRAEFSASPRVSTFLSTISRYRMSVRHLAGSANLPSDFSSRNAPPCLDATCQICSFVSRLEEATVRQISVNDVMSGSCRLPFTGRRSWLTIQQDCADLRRTKAHLSQGTRPSRKQTKIRDAKRYLQVASIARDGLIVVSRDEPFAPSRELIVVPRQVVPGLLCALHIKFLHPTQHQLKQVFSRYFYALDLDAHLAQLYAGCHSCAALKKLPPPLVENSTSLPSAVGISYAADVMHHERQLILVVRETVTSHTLTCFVSDERAATLESALISLCVSLRAVDGPPVTVRVDPAPGFVSLSSSDALKRAGICLEVGRVHNKNKNPSAEHAIGELRCELKRINPEGGAVSMATLAIATSRLNSRLRHSGMSSLELLCARDQYTHSMISVDDRELISQLQTARLKNHPYDYTCKSRTHGRLPPTHVAPGDLVYHAGDRKKTQARPRYLVTAIDGDMVLVRRFASTQLMPKQYRFRLSECFRVPFLDPPEPESLRSPDHDISSSDDEFPMQSPGPEVLVPAEIAEAPAQTPPAPREAPPPPPAPPSPTAHRQRPRRNTRLPRYLDDYEVTLR